MCLKWVTHLSLALSLSRSLFSMHGRRLKWGHSWNYAWSSQRFSNNSQHAYFFHVSLDFFSFLVSFYLFLRFTPLSFSLFPNIFFLDTSLVAVNRETSWTEFRQQMRSRELPAYLSLNRLLNGTLSYPWCYFFFVCSNLAHQKCNSWSCMTDGRMDRRTDWHTLL